LLLAIGDTSEATRLLDLSLEALPTLGMDLIDQVPEAATFVRAMALRAELAAQANDLRTASRWSRNVVALWSAADQDLQTTVGRMRALASIRSR
jgi:hypothetical protein